MEKNPYTWDDGSHKCISWEDGGQNSQWLSFKYLSNRLLTFIWELSTVKSDLNQVFQNFQEKIMYHVNKYTNNCSISPKQKAVKLF